jgi:regulator of protease activity HflC (stomatin/prohibitin superfamily)
MTIFFQKLLEWLDKLKFWTEVEPDELGVLVRLGKFKRELTNGYYLIWPILDRTRIIKRSLQVTNLPNQSIIDASGVPWAVSGVVRYTINDAKKAMLETFDVDATIQNRAMELIAKWVSEYQNVGNNFALTRSMLESFVFKTLKSEAVDWGVELKAFSITDLAKHRVYRLMTHDMTKLGYFGSNSY